jgi:subtilisin family serine protease
MRQLRSLIVPVFVAIAAAAVFAVTRPTHDTRVYSEATTWRSLVGEAHPQVTIGQRRIVVLKAPSVSQHLAVAKYATEAEERQWTAQAYTAQQQVLVSLAANGFGVRPDYSYARVLNGFSAVLDPRAEALLEQDPRVAGIYPVRAAFPATVSSIRLAKTAAALPMPAALPHFTGRGVEIALLDTAVDRSQPYLGGRVEPGINIVASHVSTRERHGTELAGLLVGARGPQGIHGVAPGASLLPIRIAGSQPDSSGHPAVYARSDQLIAGLDRAVDPNGDGDTHDAARIALIGVTEPYAAFADSPEAQAVNGAFRLDTLVVVPAGNEGVAGPVYGSLDGPGGADSALTVGAIDPRPDTASVHVAVWHGLRVAFDGRLPLLGAVTPPRALDLEVGFPRGDGEQVEDYFSKRGIGLVSGKAALVQAGGDPGAAAAAASQAGAVVVLFYGANLPAGSLGLSSDVHVPVIAIPATAASAILERLKHRTRVGVAIGRARIEANPLARRPASFSSRGLAFSGALKPELESPGIGLATSDPGTATDGEPAFATVNGTSVAAAAVAGQAAVLVEARPELSAAQLLSLLVGSARGGVVDVGAGAAGELTASAATLSFGPGTTREIALHNVSPRRFIVTAAADPAVTVTPARVDLRSGAGAHIHVRVHEPAGSDGVLELLTAGGQQLRIPWIVVPRAPGSSLIRRAALDTVSFAPSDETPAVLTVDAGRVATNHGAQIEPVSRLDVLLYKSTGAFIGLLARERDLLPGTYSFAVTGRGPQGSTLTPGRYELRVVAWPTNGGAPSRARVPFAIQ